jgi:hypothetical protein
MKILEGWMGNKVRLKKTFGGSDLRSKVKGRKFKLKECE